MNNICQFENCNKIAKYAKVYNQPIFCIKHKEDGMRTALYVCKCGAKRPFYGFPNSDPCCCYNCKEPDMIDVVHKRCKCKKMCNPAFGYEGESPICCSACKEKDMINLKKKVCSVCKIIQPTFGLDYDKPATHCLKCKTKDMFDVKNKMCVVCKKIRPSFGLDLNKAATHCDKCKTEEMLDIVNKNKYCIICKKVRATYGIEKGKSTHCVSCKGINMLNVLDNMCIKCNLIRPCFGFENDKIGTYCLSCKLPGMINIKDKNNKCICGKHIPSFGLKDDERPSCCSDCKTDDMKTYWKKKCNCGSFKEPRYNYEGEKPICCGLCKKDGMIDVYTKNICICGIIANFGYENDENPTCCFKCKKNGMINIMSEKCKANQKGIICPQTANRKYKGYCTRCFAHLFPNDPLTFQINCKTKEIAVRDYINVNFEGFQHDTPLWIGGCDCTHKRRIDHRKLIGNTLLCIETDENQHKNYDKIDEELRYDDLMMIHGGKFIFIRFNPDKYKEKGKSKNPTISKRLPVLKIEIERQINRIEKEENSELVEIIKLYYDVE